MCKNKKQSQPRKEIDKIKTNTGKNSPQIWSMHEKRQRDRENTCMSF